MWGLPGVLLDGVKLSSFLEWRIAEEEENAWEQYPICCVLSTSNVRPLKRVFDRRALSSNAKEQPTILRLVKPDDEDQEVWWVRQNGEGRNTSYQRFLLPNLVYHEEDCACMCANDPSVVQVEEEPRIVHTVNNKTSMKVPKEQTVYDKFVVDDLVYDPATQNWTTATDKASEMLEQLIETEDVEYMNVQCNDDRKDRQIEARSNYTRISRKELFGRTSRKREDPKAMLADYKTSF
mmetsp:Transcript_13453/g.46840  ORF Transcript_13453/g.46840 Transcript_13453/m.46840 type:complete len:236 (+) Transcript_13453:133-840(+)